MALIKVNTRGQSADFSASRNFHNRIINGDMRIHQRGGTATINATGVTYNVDRWLGRGVGSAGVFTLAQDSESPDGFTKSLKATVTTADSSIASGSSYRIMQHIEGYNMNDMGWGTSSAQNVMLSFWVRSSVTGTFGGGLANGDYNRFRPFSYTISSANTWEKKTVSIPGDTSGTWSYTTDLGIRLNFSIGAGSSKVGATSAWGTSSLEGATGQTNLISTNGATFYLTGVKLENGTTATDFEHRTFADELAACHRYFFSALGDTTSNYSIFPVNFRNHISTGNNGHIAFQVSLPSKMRTRPTLTHNLANSNHAGSGGGASTTTWNFYHQNQGWSSYAGNGNMNTLSSGPAGNAGVALGTYYISPAGASGDQLAIGNSLQMHFSAEL